MIKLWWGGEITKRLIIVLTFIMVSFSLSASSPPERIRPDTGQRFRIWRSFSMTGGNYTECDIWVIQCTADTDTEKILEEIRAFHEKLNGESDSLTIYLFRSKKDLIDGDCLSINTYLKENEDDEKEIDNRSIDGNDGTCYEH